MLRSTPQGPLERSTAVLARPQKFSELALAVALTTAVLQFLEVLPFAPLSLWWLLLCAPALVGAPKPRWPIAVAVVVAAANVIISSWSPVPLEAIRMAANFTGLAVSMALAARVAKVPSRLSRPFAWAAPALALQSVLTVVFYLRPEIEQRYFDWSLAPYFSGAGVKLLFTTGFNNVVLPEKSGGFILNGNTASMFMAMAAWIYFGLGVKLGRRWMMLFAVVPFGGAVGTGSKTALLLAGASIIVVFLLTLVRRSFVAGFAVAMLIPLAGLFALSALASADAFAQDTETTVGSRGRIWELAASAILRNPLQGLGYGGWLDFFRREGGFIGFNERPAHNFLLQAWLDGGVVYAILVVAVVICCAVTGLRALRASPTAREALASAALTMSLLWTFAHGLADNTWLYGEWHSLPYFGVAVAMLAQWAHRGVDNSNTVETPSPAHANEGHNGSVVGTDRFEGPARVGPFQISPRTCRSDCVFCEQDVTNRT